MADTRSEPTLVVGANGKTGRRVTERLTAAVRAVRAASRSSETRFDWDDQPTWAPALDGVDAVYIARRPVASGASRRQPTDRVRAGDAPLTGRRSHQNV